MESYFFEFQMLCSETTLPPSSSGGHLKYKRCSLNRGEDGEGVSQEAEAEGRRNRDVVEKEGAT